MCDGFSFPTSLSQSQRKGLSLSGPRPGANGRASLQDSSDSPCRTQGCGVSLIARRLHPGLCQERPPLRGSERTPRTGGEWRDGDSPFPQGCSTPSLWAGRKADARSGPTQPELDRGEGMPDVAACRAMLPSGIDFGPDEKRPHLCPFPSPERAPLLGIAQGGVGERPASRCSPELRPPPALSLKGRFCGCSRIQRGRS